MELRITVYACGKHWNGGAAITVPEPMIEAFESLKTCDEPMMAFVAGDIPAKSLENKKVLKIRKDAAKFLSEALTEHLLYEMKKLDTHNGYKTPNQPAGKVNHE